MRRAVHGEGFTVHGAWTGIRASNERIMIRHEGVRRIREEVATIVPNIGESSSASHCDIVYVTHGRLNMVMVIGMGYIGPITGVVNGVCVVRMVLFYIDVML